MPPFSGFPARSEFTPVPNLLFGPVLEETGDLDELKCALRCLYLLHQKKGWPRFLTSAELASDVSLLRALTRSEGVSAQEALEQALARCVTSGILLHLALQQEGAKEELFLVNTPQGREVVDRILRGELELPRLPQAQPVGESIQKLSIFHLYEQNIGMITPLLAEELKEAETLYPAQWIEEAFQEAVLHNRRNWRYVAAILRRWREEGKGHGEAGRRSQKVGPREYLRSYGRVTRP